MKRTSAEDLARAVPSEPVKYGDIRDWNVETKQPEFGPAQAATTVIPYEFTVSEMVSAHSLTRNVHYQYIELKDGISDPTNMMYGTGGKCPNCDVRTGYMYLGRFKAEQVVNIDLQDVMPWAFGQSFVCSAKSFWGGTNAWQTAYKRPKCFSYGTAAYRDDTTKIIFRADTDDNGKRNVDYWLSTAIKPNMRDNQAFRRDYHLSIRAIATEEVGAIKAMWLWGKFSKADQAEILANLNDALNDGITDKAQGVIDIISMEDAGNAAGPAENIALPCLDSRGQVVPCRD